MPTGLTHLTAHHRRQEIVLLLLTLNNLHTPLLGNQLTSPHPLHAPLMRLSHKRQDNLSGSLPSTLLELLQSLWHRATDLGA